MANPSEQDESLPPTARRIDEARRAGNLAVSQEAIAAASFACVWLVLGFSGAALAGGLAAYLRTAIARATAGSSVALAFRDGGASLAATLAWPLLAAAAGTTLAWLAQTGGRLAAPSSRGRTRRLVSWFRALIGGGSAARTLAGLAKAAILLAVAGASVRRAIATCAMLPRAAKAQVGHALATWLVQTGSDLAVALIMLGIADYGWRWWRHRRLLRMSPYEARKEERESEGDPEAKAERRRLHLALSTAATLADLATADLVLSEPGIAAVAIASTGATGTASVLVARGTGPGGRRLEAVARGMGLRVIVDPAMVRALDFCEESAPIPSVLRAPLARLAARAKGEPRRGSGQAGRDP